MKSNPFLFPSLLAIGFVGIPCLTSEAQTTGVPGFISYQGHVLDNAGEVVAKDSAVNRTVIFRIWDHVSAIAEANLIYSEEQTVTIADGEFSVLVGQGVATAVEKYGYSETAKGPPDTKIADAFNGTERYLGVTIDDGDAGTVDNEISPRQRIVSSAFAFRAKYAETLGTAQGTALTVLDNGRVGVGTAAPTHPLQVTGGIASRSTTASDGYVTMNPGSAANAGYLEWFNPGGTRIAYLGFNATDLRLNLENGKNFVVANGETHLHGNLYSGAHHIVGNRGTHGQGVHLEWNKDGGGGKTYLLNQKGGGPGGMVFGEVDGANGITERMVIHPNGWLDAKVGFVTGGSVVVDGANANNNLIFGNGSLESIGSRRTPGTNQYGLDFITLGQPRLSITNGGNVGIGTSVPAVRLDVNGPIRSSNGIAGPEVGVNGGTGQRLILWPGSDSATPFGFGIAGATMWRAVPTGSYHIWYENTTERMRIAAGGNVGIGTTAPADRLDVSGVIRGHGFRCREALGGTVGNVFNFLWSGSNMAAYIDNSFVGWVGGTSDRRLKEKIQPMKDGAIERVMALKPASFNYKNLPGTIYTGDAQAKEGFIADELQQIIPSAVTGKKDAVTEDGKIQPQVISDTPIVALLTKAVQEQQQTIQKQQDEIDALKAAVQALVETAAK